LDRQTVQSEFIVSVFLTYFHDINLVAVAAYELSSAMRAHLHTTTIMVILSGFHLAVVANLISQTLPTVHRSVRLDTRKNFIADANLRHHATNVRPLHLMAVWTRNVFARSISLFHIVLLVNFVN